MHIPTEPIGSIPRPDYLIEAIRMRATGIDPQLDAVYERAVAQTVRELEATGSPVITLEQALRHAHVPLEQAVISPSALSLMIDPSGSRELGLRE